MSCPLLVYNSTHLSLLAWEVKETSILRELESINLFKAINELVPGTKDL